MTFKLQIELGNDAMQDPADVAEALEYVAESLRNRGFDETGEPTPPIYDVNGNRVGAWRVTRR